MVVYVCRSARAYERGLTEAFETAVSGASMTARIRAVAKIARYMEQEGEPHRKAVLGDLERVEAQARTFGSYDLGNYISMRLKELKEDGPYAIN